jgi:hypothetical protein
MFVDAEKRDSTTTHSGAVAMSMPVTEELIQRSPSAMAENGIANSTRAKIKSAHLWLPRECAAAARLP